MKIAGFSRNLKKLSHYLVSVILSTILEESPHHLPPIYNLNLLVWIQLFFKGQHILHCSLVVHLNTTLFVLLLYLPTCCQIQPLVWKISFIGFRKVILSFFFLFKVRTMINMTCSNVAVVSTLF